MKLTAIIIALAAGLGVTKPLRAADEKPYPLKTCIVSGEELGTMGKPVTLKRDGQEVKLCCKGCLKKFEKHEAEYLKEIAEKSKS